MIVLRNGFTYFANIIVLASALVIFATVDNQDLQFRMLGLESILMGLVTTIFYICSVREPRLAKLAIEREKVY